MNSDQKKEFEETLDIDFSYSAKGIARFRVNLFQQKEGAA